MWARNIELMLGCWLLASPFVLDHVGDAELLATDFVAGGAVVLLSLFAYWPPTRRAHLLTLLLALALIVVGWTADHPRPPASQNYIVIGLLLSVFAIVPSSATRPPPEWADLLEERLGRDEADPRARG